MSTPAGYHPLQGSECRPAEQAQRVSAADPGQALSVTVILKGTAHAEDHQRVFAFARAHGLRFDRTSTPQELVLSGTVAEMNAAFAIELGLYAWGARTYRGWEGFLHLPVELMQIIGEVIGLLEHDPVAAGPWLPPSFPGEGSSRSGGREKRPIRSIAHWTSPKDGPAGPVTPGSYSILSSYDIDWLGTAGFGVMLDNFAASPGAFTTVRVMKALSSGKAELGSQVTNLAPALDTVWASAAAPATSAPQFPVNGPTIAGLIELTQRGLVPYVVLGFFPAGVYNNTMGGVPPQNSTYGPDSTYLATHPDDWGIILSNWSQLITAFFQALYQEFGAAIGEWWFEVWNEPDNPGFWLPDSQPTAPPDPAPLAYYRQLYQATVNAIAAADLPPQVKVRVGGPALMANTYTLDPNGIKTNLEYALPSFLDYVYYGGALNAQMPAKPPLPCEFISLHAKGDWEAIHLPDLTQGPGTGVIGTVEATVSQFTSQSPYAGHFKGISIVNNEADMRVGDGVPFYPRMTSQFPAWLTALMIASDSLSFEYSAQRVQFVSGSDNAHLELVGWQPPPSTDMDGPGSMNGRSAFGQQRSIMTAASSWEAGTPQTPVPPADLVKVPVYNFYELLRLLGDQHGAFVSGQQNFYPTSADSDLFSAITVGAPGGSLTHVCWVFCVYPTAPGDLPTSGATVGTPQSWSTYVEVIGLPTAWKKINWVQFQIGPAAAKGALVENDSFTVAQTGQPEGIPAPPQVNPQTGYWQYEMPLAPTEVDVTHAAFDAGTIRMHQELGLVQYMPDIAIENGVWQSPAPVNFEPYSSTVFWITPYDKSAAATPIAPTQASYTPPGAPAQPIAIAALDGANVVITWRYPPIDPNAPGFDPSDPLYYSFFYFEVQRDGMTISPVPAATTRDAPAWSYALRAMRWVDTGHPSTRNKPDYIYTIRACNASGTFGPMLQALPLAVP